MEELEIHFCDSMLLFIMVLYFDFTCIFTQVWLSGASSSAELYTIQTVSKQLCSNKQENNTVSVAQLISYETNLLSAIKQLCRTVMTGYNVP